MLPECMLVVQDLDFKGYHTLPIKGLVTRYYREGGGGATKGRGVGKGGSRGSDDPPFLGANFIHFLYKVFGLRSVQKKTFKN